MVFLNLHEEKNLFVNQIQTIKKKKNLAPSRYLYKLTDKPKCVNIPTIFSAKPQSQIWLKRDVHQRREPAKACLISNLKTYLNFLTNK